MKSESEIMTSTIVVEAGDGSALKRRATLFTCSCGALVFTVFQIEGQQHVHLQCNECETSFCTGKGECHE